MQVNPAIIAAGIVKRERRCLSRAITLTESTLPEHAEIIGTVLREARQLSQQKALREAGAAGALRALCKPRIAITGTGGAGKSSLIEALGMRLVEKRGVQLGVLAVDPSDADRGGSVLGDKTRMEALSQHPNAFVRPSPSRGHLGGATARCWEALEVFEAAGFDMTMLETVGVGQSEIEARYLTDLFVLCVPPLGGDDLQGVKRGIMHAADLIVVTKADEDSPAQFALAEQAASFYRRSASMLYAAPTNHHSTMLMQRMASRDGDAGSNKSSREHTECLGAREPTEVMMVSAKTGYNVDALADKIFELFLQRAERGIVQQMRQEQRLRHFRAYFEQSVVERSTRRLRDTNRWEAFEDQVASHAKTPREAGNKALEEVLAPPVRTQEQPIVWNTIE